jgi:rhodanese-related sulfurtransferase
MGEEGSNPPACSFDNNNAIKKVHEENIIIEAKQQQQIGKNKFQHISCSDFYDKVWKKVCDDNKNCNGSNGIMFLDVRAKYQYDICSLPFPFKNLPYNEFDLQKDIYFKSYIEHNYMDVKIYILCRRGNASQRAANKLVEWGFKNVFNIDGGLQQWQKDVDDSFPVY